MCCLLVVKQKVGIVVPGTRDPLNLGSYGVELALKNMEYKAMDDSAIKEAMASVMLLTVIWGTCIVVGKCDIEDSVVIDGKDTKGLSLTGVAMNGIQNGKTHKFGEPFPGCFGKMGNLFDLTAGMPGNQLLIEKPYCNGNLQLPRWVPHCLSYMSRVMNKVKTRNIV